MSNETTAVPPVAAAVAAAPSYGRIARVSLPMAASTAAATAAQVVVIGLVGAIGGDALYVRSVYTPVAYLFLALMTGLAVTLTVAVAQSRGGPGEHAALLGSVARAAVGLFAVLGVALAVLSGPLADAVRVADGERATFHAFLLAMTAATVLGALGELGSAVLRGLGATGTAALVTAVYVALNVGIVALGGIVAGGGLMVVPLAAGVAGAAEILLSLALLVRLRQVELRGVRRWRPAVPGMLVRIGLPVGASLMVMSLVNLVLLRIVAPAGPDAVAGFTVGYAVQTAVIVPAVGFGAGVAILMNRSLAEGGVEVARVVLRRGMLLAAAGYALVTLVLLVAGGPLATLLSGDPAVAAQARHLVALVGPTFGATGLTLVVLTVLEQVGYGLLAVVLNCVYFGSVIVVGALAVGSGPDVTGLYVTMAVAAVGGLLTGGTIGLRAARRPRVPAVR